MQEEYIFETGIIVGRFQHIHKGHEKLINTGLKLCRKLLVFIGSANMEKSKKNPFEYEYRKELIELIYKDEIENGKLILAPINDLEDPTLLDESWGQYVIENARNILNEMPSLIIYGKDKDIFKCFPKKIVKNISEVYFDRKQLEISATQMREYLNNDDFENWKKYANPKIHFKYNELKEKLK